MIEAAETTFGLERDLQHALRASIDQLERGLRIVDGGRERSTDAGRRWLSIVFTVTGIANFIALAQGGGIPPPWVTYSPLLPLALLLFSGLYLFVLPHATTWRKGQHTEAQSTVLG